MNDLHEFYRRANSNRETYPNCALPDLFAKTCGRFADRVAVVCEDEKLTFRQLDQAANRLAHYLIRLGVQPGDLVGLCCDRNIDTLVMLNGILRAGAGYVPLDPDYPVDRLQYMAEIADLKHIVAHQTQRCLVDSFGTRPVYYDMLGDELAAQSDELPEVVIDPAKDLAYVIFTSGSTGKPKGVMVSHQTVVNLLLAFSDSPGFGADDSILATTTLSFDMSVVEMFLPMVTGGQVVVVDRQTAKDQTRLVETIERHQVTCLQATPSMWRIICEGGFSGGPQLKFFIGGEPLPRDLIGPLLQRCGQLWNCYGPTEATVFSSVKQVTDAQERILIGRPLTNTTAYVVGKDGKLCAPEQEGELWIGGDCVTLGYLKRDDLTAERFVDFNGERVYRSGDLAKILENGEVEALGRIDNQIKLHGHRIELGEIDAVMKAANDDIRLAAAVVREDTIGDKQLIGYLLPHDGKTIDTQQVKAEIAKSLPAYMVPAIISVVEEFPYTPSGKTDRNGFPPPTTTRPDLGIAFVPAQSPQQKLLTDIWQNVLQLDRIGIEDNFFALGGNSLKALKVVKQSNQALDSNVSNAEFFDAPTIRRFVEIAGEQNTNSPQDAVAKSPTRATETNRPIDSAQPHHNSDADSCRMDQFAVVGLAARMPGAENVQRFWQNLIDEKETIRFFDKAELDLSLTPEIVNSSNYVAARGIIDDADKIDARFFGMPPREAELVDPQQRLMLELSWTALEDAGCLPGKFDGTIGVWAGCYQSTYYQRNLLTRPELVAELGEFQLGAHNEKDYIASRVAYRLNLRGPAVNVNTACSTSLVAIIEACQSLNEGRCDAAIAGGVSIYFPQNSGHLYQEGSIFSPDGHCRPFDASAAGTLFSDGAGVVVLKRLADAVADNDRIYGIIKGWGINNDGGEKASFSAPSINGQAAAIAMAHQHAQIAPDTIGYVETHGTATPIGDPIEVAALGRAFNCSKEKSNPATTNQSNTCLIGSVKGNIGHTVAAAGVAGFIKTVLSLHHERIPATLHFQTANPQIGIASTPFSVCAKTQSWPRVTSSSSPRRAAVSSFGVGGTNAHVVLEEAPQPTASADQPDEQYHLLTVSAKTESAREKAVANLRDFLPNTDDSIADIAHTLNQGRATFAFKAFCVANGKGQAHRQLTATRAPDFIARRSLANQRQVVFMFPGQGAQYVQMGRDLYQRLPVFRNSLNQCLEILRPLIGCDLREILISSGESGEQAEQILQATQYTQPALFSTGYSLAQTMLSLGVEPVAMVGHSIGEFAAACVAGVFDLSDGLRLIAKRGELMQSLPGGKMMSVRQSGVELENSMSDQMAIAAYNGPELCVVAGPGEQIDELKKRLERDQIVCRELHTSHAFHSPMMDTIVDPFSKFISEMELNSPQYPILSTVTGNWIKDEEATDPTYWAEHLRQPVRFSDAVTQLWQKDPSLVLLELGPRKTLSKLAYQHATDRKNQFAVPAMSDTVKDHAEWRTFLHSIGNLWSLGVDIDLSKLPSLGRKISLPGYPFERKRFFIESPNNEVSLPSTTSTAQPLSNQSQTTTTTNQTSEPMPSGTLAMSRIPQIIEQISNVFEGVSGLNLNDFEQDTTFFEIGLDSLVLTQVATALKRHFSVKVTFRQLLEDFPNAISLAEFLDQNLPADKFAAPIDNVPATSAVVENSIPEPIQQAQAPQPIQSTATELPAPVLQVTPQPLATVTPAPLSNSTGAEAIIQNQLQIMAAQLQLLGGGNATAPLAPQANPVDSNPNSQPQPSADTMTGSLPAHPTTAEPKAKPAASVEAVASNDLDSNTAKKKAFGAAARVELKGDQLNAPQQQLLEKIIQQTTAMMPNSKKYAQQHRQYLADPRTVSGFRPNMKEMTFPIVVERSKDAVLQDIDGNSFIDFTCGFGSNFLGHCHELVVNAISHQLTEDYSIGPQSPLAGEVAKLFCDLTGNERMAFANSGSEAVLGCTRLARSYTGKQKIVMFTGDYHGILDEVIVRGNKDGRSFPAATGIPNEHVENTLILEYGTEEALRIIEENLDELAAVVVETVQSRKPELQPREFLQKLQSITANADTALIFDEVITGFRISPGGAQQHFGVRADLVAYGKVVGGGMPIGIIGGRAKYMDGLDGGFWQYEDQSRPEAGMTYFAGTFVRHPLTLAAARSILEFIQSQGQPMYDRLNSLADDMSRQLNDLFERLDAPLYLANFGSLFKVQFKSENPYAELLFAMLRLKGFFVWDQRPCLLNIKHTQQHIQDFINAFAEVVCELQAAGFLSGEGYKTHSRFTQKAADLDLNQPPIPGARLGKDRLGNPGWFIADAKNPGQFIQVPQTVQ